MKKNIVFIIAMVFALTAILVWADQKATIDKNTQKDIDKTSLKAEQPSPQQQQTAGDPEGLTSKYVTEKQKTQSKYALSADNPKVTAEKKALLPKKTELDKQ
ncbi:MAG: hypothetical protein GY839_19775 [candidate division Zixibacteria bacterium]|nr:hypothetical protein [candidate division Zixibacteria bacterium]